MLYAFSLFASLPSLTVFVASAFALNVYVPVEGQVHVKLFVCAMLMSRTLTLILPMYVVPR